ncbi:DUF2963 domain-containing protein, partial ['Elaeagnus angustifolia' witches'-broom phytoplasma]|nr:DUF2963 domain-containing protein ['Elaeagnus angustifolia' witches'-broom phytoplasma]
VKFFKTKLYQNISDFKKLNLTAIQLKDIGFTFQQIKEAGYTEQEIVYRSDGKTIHYIKILDSKTKKEFKRIIYNS